MSNGVHVQNELKYIQGSAQYTGWYYPPDINNHILGGKFVLCN